MDNTGGCDNAFSFCGVRSRRFPDRKAMGFPFDRLPRAGVALLSQFLTPNMRATNIQIRYVNTIQNGPTFNNSNTASSRITTTGATKKGAKN